MTEKIKLGILDLLTILVPGGLLLMVLLRASRGDWTLNVVNLHNTQEWIIAAIAIATAYIIGHFIYFFASFLDDFIYEKVARVYWHDHKKLVYYVLKFKTLKTGISDRKVMNALKWSCARLMSKQPAIYEEVERVMAESKLFRSLIVVFLFSAFLLSNLNTMKPGYFFVLAFLSLIRYLMQRQKSLETAYHGIITTAKNAGYVGLNKKELGDLEKTLLKFRLAEKLKAIKRIEHRLSYRQFLFWRVKAVQLGAMKFFTALLLCIIPGFERLFTPGSNSRRNNNKDLMPEPPPRVTAIAPPLVKN
jgi:hypothetical protein